MKPGRAPKPTNLKLVQGNPSGRPFAKDEPIPEIESPDCPDHLTDDARIEWNRITPLLLELRLITQADMAALALYCQAYGRWKLAEAKMAETKDNGSGGLLIKAPSGYPIQSPYLAISNRAMEDLHKYLQHFGLSPSSRTRVSANPDGGKLTDGKNKASKYF